MQALLEWLQVINLGKRGIDTLLIDAYDPPHGMGSHHGETRLICHALGESSQYVPFVLRAQELWSELENELKFYRNRDASRRGGGCTIC